MKNITFSYGQWHSLKWTVSIRLWKSLSFTHVLKRMSNGYACIKTQPHPNFIVIFSTQTSPTPMNCFMDWTDALLFFSFFFSWVLSIHPTEPFMLSWTERNVTSCFVGIDVQITSYVQNKEKLCGFDVKKKKLKFNKNSEYLDGHFSDKWRIQC